MNLFQILFSLMQIALDCINGNRKHCCQKSDFLVAILAHSPKRLRDNCLIVLLSYSVEKPFLFANHLSIFKPQRWAVVQQSHQMLCRRLFSVQPVNKEQPLKVVFVGGDVCLGECGISESPLSQASFHSNCVHLGCASQDTVFVQRKFPMHGLL